MPEQSRPARTGERLPAADDQEAKQRWGAGLVVPHFITLALDAAGLHGPEVDEACGAHEPEVDLWEAGELYPAWDQLCKLAELTGVTPAYFVRPVEDRVEIAWTSAAFHVKNWEPPKPPILAFKPSARGAMVQGRLW